MEILKCNSGRILIKMGNDFSGITIYALGERIMDWKGFCISVSSIKQIEPVEKTLSPDEKKAIAIAISECTTLSMPIEFYEVL